MALQNKSISGSQLVVYLSIKKYIVLTIFIGACYYSHAQVKGCTDRAANNYNNTATVNDGSCTYTDISIKPTFNTNLDATLSETSGLIWWNNQVWTHNDSGGEPALYATDPATGKIV